MTSRMRTRAVAVFMLAGSAFSAVAAASDFDIRGINFKQAHPLAGESLLDVVAEPSKDSMAILGMDADVLKAYPKLRIRVVGFTDDRECRGNACFELSLRRAKYVRDWLISQGIPGWQMDGPEGHGSAEPVADNQQEQGRAYNRRVEVQALTYPNGEIYSLPYER